MRKIKHIFIDMDGTLTESRSQIKQEMIDAIMRVQSLGTTFAVISGATKEQMIKQIGFLPAITIMAESGNDASFLGGMTYWVNTLDKEDIEEVTKYLAPLVDVNEPDKLEVRKCQVSYSFLGHNADKELKRAYDPKGDKRRQFLADNPFTVPGMIARVGGTTCIDFTKEGWGKRGNIERFIELGEYDKAECLYIGDQLYEGGNDEDVMELIDCYSVGSPEDTIFALNNIYEQEK